VNDSSHCRPTWRTYIATVQGGPLVDAPAPGDCLILVRYYLPYYSLSHCTVNRKSEDFVVVETLAVFLMAVDEQTVVHSSRQ